MRAAMGPLLTECLEMAQKREAVQTWATAQTSAAASSEVVERWPHLVRQKGVVAPTMAVDRVGKGTPAMPQGQDWPANRDPQVCFPSRAAAMRHHLHARWWAEYSWLYYVHQVQRGEAPARGARYR